MSEFHEHLASHSAADPVLEAESFWWQPLAVVSLKVLVVFVIGLVEPCSWSGSSEDCRRHAKPSRSKQGSPFGLHLFADGTSCSSRRPHSKKADRSYSALPFLAFVPAFLIGPLSLSEAISPTVTTERSPSGGVTVQLADPPIGVLLVLAMSSIAVYGVMLAGWSSGSKYPLLGSVRASAQMISYEAALGLSLAAVLMTAGTLSTSGSSPGLDHDWHLLSTELSRSWSSSCDDQTQPPSV